MYYDLFLVALCAVPLNVTLNVCEFYAKTKLMYFTLNNRSPGSIQLMGNTFKTSIIL